jgi:hypothetical protein
MSGFHLKLDFLDYYRSRLFSTGIDDVNSWGNKSPERHGKIGIMGERLVFFKHIWYKHYTKTTPLRTDTTTVTNIKIT